MTKFKKITACFLSVALSASMVASVLAQAAALDNWSTIQKDFTQVALAPGADPSQLNFAWYSA